MPLSNLNRAKQFNQKLKLPSFKTFIIFSGHNKHYAISGSRKIFKPVNLSHGIDWTWEVNIIDSSCLISCMTDSVIDVPLVERFKG